MGISAFNDVYLIGRLTNDPELKYTTSQIASLRFSLAIDNGKDRSGNDLPPDFPSIVCWGKFAENYEKYLKKGRLVAVHAQVKTGSYEKNGKKYYTQDLRADRIKFLERASDIQPSPKGNEQMSFMSDDEIPF